MKQNKIFWPLMILGLIQIGTAIFFMLPASIVEAVGFISVSSELLVYVYVVCSLYFSLGILYLMGARMDGVRFPALMIACIDIPLEIMSYVVGFPHMSIPYWMIFLFCIIIMIPCIFCYYYLIRNYCLKKSSNRNMEDKR